MFLKNKPTNKFFQKTNEIEDAVLSLSEKEVTIIEKKPHLFWLNFFWWIIILFLLILSGRVFYLTVVRGNYYNKLAQKNKIRSLIIKAPRGLIYDYKRRLLVHNIPSMNVVVYPYDLPSQSKKRKEIAEKLAKILKINRGEIWGILENSEKNIDKIYILKKGVSYDESLKIIERASEFPGVKIEKDALRQYVDGMIFSHLIGYTGKIEKNELDKLKKYGYFMFDDIGKSGLEKSYEKILRGKFGYKKIEVDAQGKMKTSLGEQSPQPGNDLVLNIDADLQKKIYDVLSQILEKEKLKAAAAVALNPKNGGVLALVSLPSYDNNLFAQGITLKDYQKLITNPLKPMYNRALTGEYPPGSTIKPLLAAAALKEGVITEHTQIESKGGIKVGKYYFGDWKAHGWTDVRRAIAVSSDVFFYSVGGGYGNIKGMGMSTMKKYEELFGLNHLTGIDLPNESTGFIPDENWKKQKFNEPWYRGNSYHAAIGQGYITVTPLQIANYISAIANKGTLFKPRVVSQIIKNNGETINLPPQIIRKNFIDKSILKIVREGMRMTITQGTAQMLKELPVEVAGKTGTAQFGNKNKTHGWFVSFAPYKDPKIVLVILFENQEGHGYYAVPATKEIYQWYFQNKKIQE